MLRPASIFLTKLITGANAVWAGCDPKCEKLRIYFANHGSHLDFATLWAALPSAARERTRPVAARDYWGRTRLTRAVACGIFNSLLIAREAISRTENPISQMADACEPVSPSSFFQKAPAAWTGISLSSSPVFITWRTRCRKRN
nr:hypothetical protein [Verrucomicrobium spinosum]